MYANNLKINKGVDNVILFQCYNQDQKPVDISASTFVFRIIDQTGSEILLTKPLEVVSAVRGRAKLVVRAADTWHLPTQLCSYSLVRADATDYSTIQEVLTEPAFVDDFAGARGTIDVVDSVFPRTQPSAEVTIPDLVHPPEDTTPVTHYSSELNRGENGVTTFQLWLDGFEGEVTVEGASAPGAPWYDATLPALWTTPHTGTELISATGFFGVTRLRIVQEAGKITKILAR